MISKTTLIDLKEGILRQQCYKPKAWHDRLQSEVMDEHAHACKRLAHAMKDQSLFPALLHDWWSCKTSLFSVLQVTIKTHKDPGEVKPRQLHTTPYHPMRPAMRFISWQLNKLLKQQHHIIRDSADFAKKISSITVPSDALIVRFDVRDFYMTGMHEHLIAGCKANIDPEIADEVGDLLDTILSNQFVWREPSSIAYRVKLGSGMGLACSGEISDTCFFELCERHYAVVPATRENHSIHFYARFRDDGFFVISGPREPRQHFLKEFKKMR